MPKADSNRRNVNEVPLIIGCSKGKEEVLLQLCQDWVEFERTGQERGSQLPTIVVEDEWVLAEKSLTGELNLVWPDSCLWLEALRDKLDEAAIQVSELTIFALTPLLVAVSPATSRRLRTEGRVPTMKNLLEEALENPEFRWSHPHVRSTAGFLSFTAQALHLAGSPEEILPSHLENLDSAAVRKLQERIRQYGPSPSEVAKTSYADGEWFTDAFVSDERSIASAFRTGTQKQPLLLRPLEGGLWLDHPLVLLARRGSDTSPSRSYASFRDYLLGPEAQMVLTAAGFRGVGPDVQAYFRRPQIPGFVSEVLFRSQVRSQQIPVAYVGAALRASWFEKKKRAAVYLLLDVSGSMEGLKLQQAKEGLVSYLDQFDNEDDLVGLITFTSQPDLAVPLAPLRGNNAGIRCSVAALQAGGQTALVDAALLAYRELRGAPDASRTNNSIVMLTDGGQNYGKPSETLEDAFRQVKRSPTPVTLFGLAYGEDADLDFMQRLAKITGATAETATPETIVNMYKRMARFV